MTLEDLKKQDLLQTRSIAEACKDSPETLEYIISCLARFFSGDLTRTYKKAKGIF